jgi:hypothetical protein
MKLAPPCAFVAASIAADAHAEELPASCPTLKIDRPEDSEEGAKPYAAYLKSPKSADALAELGHFVVSIGDLDAGEYLGLQALTIDAKHGSAKGLLEKIGVLRSD